MVEEESEVFSVRGTKEKRKEGHLKNRPLQNSPTVLRAGQRTAREGGDSTALQLQGHQLPLTPADTQR